MSGLDTATGGYLNDGRGDASNGGHCDLNGSCGTGSDQITFPGDPNLNDAGLLARGSFAGITLTWTLPERSFAVAEVRVHRSLSSSFLTALQIATAAGSYYFDEAGEIKVGTRYYYWIELVSINGTVGELVGPASAVMQPPVEQILDYIEGQITSSQLAQDLMAPIGNIGVLSNLINQEISDRYGFTEELRALYGGLQDDLAAQGTLLYDRVAELKRADSNLVARITGQAAQFNANIATVRDEVITYAGQYDAFASKISQIDAWVNNPGGNPDTAAINVLSQVQAGLGGVQGQYTIKVQAVDGVTGGVVTGLGILANEERSDFIVSAENFSIMIPPKLKANGEPDGGFATVPFFVASDVNGETVIGLNAKTLIRDAQITTAMIERYVQSANYNETGNKPGWRLDQEGGFHLKGKDGKTLLKTVQDDDGGYVVVGDDISNDNTLWEDITGEGRPADYADATAANQWQPQIGWTFVRSTEGFAAAGASLWPGSGDFMRVTQQTGGGLIYNRIADADNVPYYRGSGSSSLRISYRVFGIDGDPGYWVGAVWVNINGRWQRLQNLPFPGGDWTTADIGLGTNAVISGLKFQFTSKPGANIDIDWIALGRRGAAISRIASENIGIFMEDASISNAQIKDLTVDTLKIKDNAVTVPISLSKNLGVNPIRLASAETYTKIVEHTEAWGNDLKERPQQVIVNACANFKPINNGSLDESSIRLGLQINGPTRAGGIYWFSTNIQQGFPGTISFSFGHQPASKNTYVIWAAQSRSNSWGVNRYTLTLLGAKK